MTFDRSLRRHHDAPAVDLQRGGNLMLVGPGEQHWAGPMLEELAHDRGAVRRRLAGPEDRLWESLAERAVVVDAGESEVREWETTEGRDGIVNPDSSVPHVAEHLVEIESVHAAHYPASMTRGTPERRRIAYLGPEGTFSEEALLSVADLAGCELVPVSTITDAIAACAAGEVDASFVPLENLIEGSINLTLDQLIFDVDLLIEREVLLEVHLDLLVRPGTEIDSIRRVFSFPAATAQCRHYLTRRFPSAEIVATNSTADAARIVAEEVARDAVAIAPPLAAKLYGLDVLDHAVEDHVGNVTRFALVARGPVPPRSGDDRTTVVCFQRADRPGSLAEILARFAARNINLTRIESRPTKRALGDYCFVIEFAGHVSDDLIGDCLRDLHMVTGELKFLGSYPVADGEPTVRPSEIETHRQVAEAWLSEQRRRVLGWEDP
jgi:prephenate dehydratase